MDASYDESRTHIEQISDIRTFKTQDEILQNKQQYGQHSLRTTQEQTHRGKTWKESCMPWCFQFALPWYTNDQADIPLTHIDIGQVAKSWASLCQVKTSSRTAMRTIITEPTLAT